MCRGDPLLDELLANHVPHLMQDQLGVGFFFFFGRQFRDVDGDLELRDPIYPRAWTPRR